MTSAPFYSPFSLGSVPATTIPALLAVYPCQFKTGLVTVVLLSISGQKPPFLLRNAGDCEMRFCSLSRVSNGFPCHALKVLLWCLLSCVPCLSLTCSPAKSYLGFCEREHQSFAGLNRRWCFFVCVSRSYYIYLNQNAVQNDGARGSKFI